MLIIAGLIVGILMAPAYIDQQTLELTALIAPVPVQQQQQEQKQEAKPEKMDVSKNVDVRKELIADVSRLTWCRKKFRPKPVTFRRFARAW